MNDKKYRFLGTMNLQMKTLKVSLEKQVVGETEILYHFLILLIVVLQIQTP